MPLCVLCLRTGGVMAGGLVPVPEIFVGHQGRLCCCCWKGAALGPLLVAISSSNSFELSGFLAMVTAKSCISQ